MTNIQELTLEKIDKLKPSYINNNYSIPKWIVFSECMLKKGFKVYLVRSKSTVSKYIYVYNHNTKSKGYKIRFSNHKPNKYKENNNDCDFYTGISNNNTLTTEKLIPKITKLLEEIK